MTATHTKDRRDVTFIVSLPKGENKVKIELETAHERVRIS